MSTVSQTPPKTFEDAADVLAAASAEDLAVRIRGGATKLGWGHPISTSPELSTAGLSELVEHNAGDLTAILQAGLPLAQAQRTFAEAGQRLALDPPLGPTEAATIGGVVATGDSGPLRHRFGAPRDLVLGMTVALSDGTIAHSGGNVIKNVAGYDLAKLFAGAFGTLGLILSVSVRLHPLAAASSTASGASSSIEHLGVAALALAQAPLEFEALDVAWRSGRGRLLARCAGPEHVRRGRRAATMLTDLGLEDVDVSQDDEGLWDAQRRAQRVTGAGALVRVAHAPSALPHVLRVVEASRGTLVGRVALGASYVQIDPGVIDRLRADLGPARTTLLDAPKAVRAELDPWAAADDPALALMRSVKQRFDPSATCNRGLFVGGL